MAWTTPRTWVAGETVTAALMNTHVRDNELALFALATADYTAYTPTLTNLTLGNGTRSAAYIQFGKLTVVTLDIVFGSTTSLSGDLAVSLPATAPAGTGSPCVGMGEVIGSAAQSWQLRARLTSTSAFALIHSDAGSAAVVGSSSPAALTTGNEIHALVIYRAA